MHFSDALIKRTWKINFRTLLPGFMILLLITPLFSYSQTWTGSVSTAWSTAGNWSAMAVPTSTGDVIIPASPTGRRFPSISTGNNYAKSLTIQSGATVSQSGGVLLMHGDWKNSGTFSATAGTVQFMASGSSAANFSSGTNQFYHLTVNSSVDPKFYNAANSSVLIQGDFTNNNASLDHTANATFTFNGTGNQNIYSASTTGKATFGNLVINKTSGSAILISRIEVDGNASITNGTFDIGIYEFLRSSSGGTITISNGAFARTGGSQTFYNFSSATIGETSTVEYYGGNQTVQPVTYGNLILSGSGNKTMLAYAFTIGGNFTLSGTTSVTAAQALTVNGNFNIGAGTTFSAGSFAHQVKGNWSNSGTFNANTSAFTFNGTGNQSVSGIAGFYNFTLNNSAGITLNTDVTVSGTLTLTSGNINAAANSKTLYVSSSAAAAISRTSGHIVGNLKRQIANSGIITYLFPVGTSSVYMPATIAFVLLGGTPGTLNVALVNGEHPNASGILNVTKSINAYWSITKQPNSFTFATYAAIFNYSSAVYDGISLPSRFILKKYNSPTWSTPIISGIPSATMIATTNALTSFSDFAVGESAPINTISTSAISPSIYCAGSAVSVPFTLSGTFNAGNVFTAQLSDASGSFASAVSIGTLTGTTAGTVSAVIPVAQAAGSGYRIRVVADNPSVTGTDNGSNLTVNALPAITTSASTADVCYSAGAQNTSLSYSAATGTPTTYTITWNSAPGFAAVTNALPASPVAIAVPAGASANTYNGTITVKNANGCVSTGSGFTVTVNPASIGGAASSNQAICTGTIPANLTLSGNTGSVIKWQKSTVSNFSSGVTDISNTSTTITGTSVGALTATTYFRAVVQSGTCAIANSAAATITVVATVAGTVSSSQVICPGTMPADLTLSGNTGSVTKWQKSTVSDFSSGVTDIAGTNTTLSGGTIGALTNASYFRAVVQNGSCAAGNSSPAAITINALPAITASASTTTICYNAGAQNTSLPYSAATGSPATYTITWSAAATAAGFAAVTNAALPVSPVTIAVPAGAAANTYNGTISVKNANGCASTGSGFTVTVNPVSAGGAVSSNQTISSGTSPANLTLSGNTGNVIKWQKSTISDFSSAVTDIANTGTTLTGASIGALTATTYFRAVVQNGVCASANSAAATVTVVASATGTVSSSQVICSGTVPADLILSGNGSVVKWQKSTVSDFSSGVTDIAITSTTLSGATIGVLTNAAYFRAVMQNSASATANSSPAAITINALPAITIPTSTANVCGGDKNITLEYKADAGPKATYSIAWSKTATNTGFASITNTALDGHSVTIEIPADAAANTYEGAISVTNENGCSSTGAGFTINVGATLRITGHPKSLTACAGSENYMFITVPEAKVTYQWLKDDEKLRDDKILTGSNSRSLSISPLAKDHAGNYSVLLTDAYGCTTMSNSAEIVVESDPPATLTITSTVSNLCKGDTIQLSTSGASTYKWRADTAVRIISGQETSKITAITGATIYSGYQFLVSGYNTCGAGSEGRRWIRTSVSVPNFISPQKNICAGEAVVYAATQGQGVVEYLWNAPKEVLINGEPAPYKSESPKVEITFPKSFTTGNIGVAASSGCGFSNYRNLALTAVPMTPVRITGRNIAGCNSTLQLYYIKPLSGYAYQWTVPGGAKINRLSAGSDSAWISFEDNFPGGEIGVTSQNVCGILSLPRILKILSANVLAPQFVTPQKNICPGETIVYVASQVKGAVAYLWNAPNEVLINGEPAPYKSESSKVEFTFPKSFTTGNIGVAASSGCGFSDYRNLALAAVPAMPGRIIGKNASVCNSSELYYVKAIQGLTYQWTVPGGAKISQLSNTTDSIWVNFPEDFAGDLINVIAQNRCGALSEPKSLMITGSPVQASVIKGPSEVCPNTTGYSFSVDEVPNATEYQWAGPAGCVVHYQGKNSVNIDFGKKIGAVKVSSLNGCGASKPRSLTLKEACGESVLNPDPGNAGGKGKLEDNSLNLQAYPDADQKTVTFTFNAPEAASYTYKLVDIANTVVLKGSIAAQQGVNMQDLNVASLPKAVYTLELASPSVTTHINIKIQ